MHGQNHIKLVQITNQAIPKQTNKFSFPSASRHRYLQKPLTVDRYDNSVSSFQRLRLDRSIAGDEAMFPGTLLAIYFYFWLESYCWTLR